MLFDTQITIFYLLYLTTSTFSELAPSLNIMWQFSETCYFEELMVGCWNE